MEQDTVVLRLQNIEIHKPGEVEPIHVNVLAEQTTDEMIAAITSEGTTQIAAVNTAGTTEVNTINTAGAAQVDVVTSKGTEQISAVASKGSEQISAIETKGEEVLASLPGDWEELNDEVDQIQEDFESIVERTENLFYLTSTAERTVNGITISVNEDGTVNLTGTATAAAQFALMGATSPTSSSQFNVEAGTYTCGLTIVSGSISKGKVHINTATGSIEFAGVSATVINNVVTQTLTDPRNVRIRIDNGTIINNVRLLAQFEKGEYLHKPEDYGITAVDKVARMKLDDPLPEYWQQYLNEKLPAIHAADIELGSSGANFVFLTDTHIETNQGWSPMLIERILKASSINDVICGGDLIGKWSTIAAATNHMTEWRNRFSVPVYYVRGNHDNNDPDGKQTDKRVSQSDFYSIYNRPVEHLVNTDKQLYYCIDNQSQHFRIIMLDHLYSDYRADMNAWLKNRLTELDSTWSVLIVQHEIWDIGGATIHSILTETMKVIDANYADINATVIGVVGGHIHFDKSDYHTVASGGGYWLIATTCDTLDSGQIALGREPGTPTEQAFDLCYVNTSARKLSMLRIGYGEDREFSF